MITGALIGFAVAVGFVGPFMLWVWRTRRNVGFAALTVAWPALAYGAIIGALIGAR